MHTTNGTKADAIRRIWKVEHELPEMAFHATAGKRVALACQDGKVLREWLLTLSADLELVTTVLADLMEDAKGHAKGA